LEYLPIADGVKYHLLTVSVADRVTPSVADIVTALVLLTLIVDMEKEADVCPAGISTLAGTVAMLELLDNATDAPPAGAGPLRVTVAVDCEPPCTFDGFSVSEDNCKAPTVRVAFRVIPPCAADIVTVVVTETEDVFTTKLALSAPAGTMTLGGVTAAGLLLLSATVRSTVPMDVNTTVPVD
jgi:hypothetical protein